MPHQENHPQPPLPPSNFNRDELLRWLEDQTISAQKLITGSIQTDQEISSSNFSSGSAGWQIDGDGNAEFNNVTVRGTVEIGDNEVIGDSTGWALPGHSQVGIPDADLKKASIRWYDTGVGPGTFLARITGLDAGEVLQLLAGDEVQVKTSGENTNAASFTFTDERLLGDDGSAAKPAYSFNSDSDTGLFRSGANVVAFTAGGDHTASFVGGDFAVKINETTGSAANIHQAGAVGGRSFLERVTSSLKYKPDWRWAGDAADYTLPTPIRWTDEKGQVRLGFGAEHIWEAVPEAFEEGFYDLRSLVAILSEKVKRLELLNPQSTGE